MIIQVEGWELSPLRIRLFATALIYVGVYKRQQSPWWLALATAHFLFALTGATMDQMSQNLRPAFHIAVLLRPGTGLPTSVWILGARFVFLIIVGYASLKSDWELNEDIELNEGDQSER